MLKNLCSLSTQEKLTFQFLVSHFLFAVSYVFSFPTVFASNTFQLAYLAKARGSVAGCCRFKSRTNQKYIVFLCRFLVH